jgi:hypothetical protein
MFLAASIEDGWGTLPINRSVPAARARLGQFPLSEAGYPLVGGQVRELSGG